MTCGHPGASPMQFGQLPVRALADLTYFEDAVGGAWVRSSIHDLAPELGRASDDHHDADSGPCRRRIGCDLTGRRRRREALLAAPWRWWARHDDPLRSAVRRVPSSSGPCSDPPGLR